MTRDRLVTRRPAPKPEDDHYMLDRWTPAVMHATRQVYRVVKREGQPDQRLYRQVCACGWRSIETPRIVSDVCPVFRALEVRARFKRSAAERVEWSPVEG